jgi:hypothetical protein
MRNIHGTDMDDTQRRFVFDDTAPAANGYYDLALLSSVANRRLYRQGRCYYAKFDIELDGVPSNSGQRIEIQTLASTWMLKKAWQLAFKKWRESTEDERKNGIKAGRWNDFRIHMDATHAGGTSTLRLADGMTTPTEYLYTVGETTTGVSPYYKVFGSSDGTAWGILNEYDTMADTEVDSPADPSGAAMAYETMLSELDEDQAQEIQENGDAPPYSATGGMEGCEVVSYLFNGMGQQRLSTGYIPVPLGLFKIIATTDNPIMSVTLKSGTYKGIHAESIL